MANVRFLIIKLKACRVWIYLKRKGNGKLIEIVRTKMTKLSFEKDFKKDIQTDWLPYRLIMTV